MRSRLLGLPMRRCVSQPLNLTAVLFPAHLACCVSECTYGSIKRQREQVDTHISKYVGVCVSVISCTPLCALSAVCGCYISTVTHD